MSRSRGGNKVYRIITFQMSGNVLSWQFHMRKKTPWANKWLAICFLEPPVCRSPWEILSPGWSPVWLLSSTKFKSHSPGCHSPVCTALFICLREAGAESCRARPRCACPLCIIRWPFLTIRRLGRCPSATALCTVFWKGLLSFQLLPGYQLVYLSWKSHITKHGRKLTSSQVWKVFLGGTWQVKPPLPQKGRLKAGNWTLY